MAQALASLAGTETNKALLVSLNAMDVLEEALLGRHHQKHLVTKYSLMCLWNIAFVEEGRARLLHEYAGGDTALHLAARAGASVPVIQYLVRRGEFVEWTNDASETPLSLVEAAGARRASLAAWMREQR